jgi:ABC-2 type transport system permease protein
MSRSLIDSPFMVLVRRELWEHRSLLWAPLAMALAIIALSLLGAAADGGMVVQYDKGGVLPGVVRDADGQRDFFSMLILGLLVPQLLVGLVAVFFYLLDCLFTERRDRSILFWKSLPVSDAKTVLSKLFVALVAVPLWIWALSLVVGLVVFGLLAAKVSGTAVATLGTWHGGEWLAMQASLLAKLAIAALWYLPVAGWLLLVSALATRAPFLWATLPFLVVAIAERAVFGSNSVAAFVVGRLFGLGQGLLSVSTKTTTNTDGAGGSVVTESVTRAQSMDSDFSSYALPEVLASPDLWLGVAAGIALVYAAIRVRRRSDDS